jgi:hypothetical protein
MQQARCCQQADGRQESTTQHEISLVLWHRRRNLGSIARWRGIRQPKMPEPKIERKCFIILISNLSKF